MVRRSCLLAALIALALPASARATAHVYVVGDTSNAIFYVSTTSTVNQLTVSPTATAGVYRVADLAEPLTPGAGCTAVDAKTVDCTTFGTNAAIRQMEVHLGPGGDTFT